MPILHLSLRHITVAVGFPLDHENLVLFQKVRKFLLPSLLGPIRHVFFLLRRVASKVALCLISPSDDVLGRYTSKSFPYTS